MADDNGNDTTPQKGMLIGLAVGLVLMAALLGHVDKG